MKYIPLNKGRVAIVDDDDYERLSCFKWIAWNKPRSSKWYAIASQTAGLKTSAERGMTRMILGVKKGHYIDHRNGNGLDNRKENLRFATPQQNAWNNRKRKNAASRYKGVSRKKEKWSAKICIDGKQIYIGTFALEEDAARAYDEKAKGLFGEFARLNFGEAGK